MGAVPHSLFFVGHLIAQGDQEVVETVKLTVRLMHDLVLPLVGVPPLVPVAVIIRINRGIGADQQGVLRVLVGALFHHGCESGVVRVVVNAQIQEFPSELGIDFIPAIFAVSDDSTDRILANLNQVLFGGGEIRNEFNPQGVVPLGDFPQLGLDAVPGPVFLFALALLLGLAALLVVFVEVDSVGANEVIVSDLAGVLGPFHHLVFG